MPRVWFCTYLTEHNLGTFHHTRVIGACPANAILSGTDLASYLPIKCLYCSPSHELSTNHILTSHEESSRISARTCTRAHMTRRYNRTDHTEIDACGSYGGSCATSFLLWEGTRCVNGCRCWGSMSEAVIVPIVKVLRQ